MRMRTPARRVLVVAALLLLTGTAGLVPAAGAAAGTARAMATGSFAPRGVLFDVAASSARSAWAVGQTGLCRSRTLIARWNGTAWKVVPGPASARRGGLDGVTVPSARTGWAVGFSGSVISPRPLILRWNGTAWTRIAGLRGSGQLVAVAATSTRNAWAVGERDTSTAFRTVIMHWNGATWTRVPSPNPAGGAVLAGIAVTSARNAWAVGFTDGGTSKTLILHWNGAAWTRVPTPNLAGSNFLQTVAATSVRNAWAVGSTLGGKALIVHWNGQAWKRVHSPVPTAELVGVTATSARNAWTTGTTRGLFGACAASTSSAKVTGSVVAARPRTVIFHWDGTAWRRTASPSPTGDAILTGVAATSARNAWAVGATGNIFGATARALILRWNGRAWR